MDIEFFKVTEIGMSKLEFRNDENLFYDNTKLINKATHSSSRDLFRYISSRAVENEYGVCEYIIKCSSKILQLKRIYEKFLNLLLIFLELLVLLFYYDSFSQYY